MKSIAKGRKSKSVRGYAIVTGRGKVLVDTIGATKREVGFFFMEWHKTSGAKIKRVTVMVDE